MKVKITDVEVFNDLQLLIKRRQEIIDEIEEDGDHYGLAGEALEAVSKSIAEKASILFMGQ